MLRGARCGFRDPQGRLEFLNLYHTSATSVPPQTPALGAFVAKHETRRECLAVGGFLMPTMATAFLGIYKGHDFEKCLTQLKGEGSCGGAKSSSGRGRITTGHQSPSLGATMEFRVMKGPGNR